MYNRLKSILDLIRELNFTSGIVPESDINEQYSNLEDFKKLTSELDLLLSNLTLISKNDGDEVEQKLFEIHRILTTFEWHFSEISDLNTKILKEYKNKINN